MENWRIYLTNKKVQKKAPSATIVKMKLHELVMIELSRYALRFNRKKIKNLNSSQNIFANMLYLIVKKDSFQELGQDS